MPMMMDQETKSKRFVVVGVDEDKQKSFHLSFLSPFFPISHPLSDSG